MVKINTLILKQCYDMATYKITKGLRPHVECIFIKYDKDNTRLTMVGTDANIMLVAEQYIIGDDERQFYADNFANGVSLAPLDEYKPKTTGDFGTIAKQGELFIIDGKHVFKALDSKYPNYNAVIPTCTKEPSFYAVFKPSFIAKADYVLGFKKQSIIETIPMMDNPRSPAVWLLDNNAKGLKKTLIIMPMNVFLLAHNETATERIKND